ncbi:hypothetical protein AN477_13735 [Alicyclobacillus ferrooxydans]|uniref:Uncharacterized protein n=2 Tax=Alicyclobacillus ferrooxydans TaxID=471514 RepID=A0A0N8PP26_9BACL|nr:hypothetical protein AN477_13735 [Alicyclobacillus ferrooxydans]
MRDEGEHMTSTVECLDGREGIIESVLTKSKCPCCGRKMEMSIFVNLDSERPLQISWGCLECTSMEQSGGRQDLSMAVPGISRAQKLDSILYITKYLTDYAQSSNKLCALNDLLQVVAVEGIRLSYLDLASTGTLLGVFFQSDGVPYIMLDQGLKARPMEHVEVLAEEVGRYIAHKATSINNDGDAANQEIFALRWAVHYLSSVPDMIERAS